MLAVDGPTLLEAAPATRETDGRPAFCVNCGAELDIELEDAADSEEYGVDYCSSCGAPVPTGSGDEESAAKSVERINCPGCGSLVAADEAECGHCREAIRTASVASSR